MSNKDVPKRLIEQTIEKFGRIDVLINNAGMIRRAPAVDFSEEDWSQILEVNLSSVFRLSQAAGRRMIEQHPVIWQLITRPRFVQTKPEIVRF